jgi:hypothetical protein
VVIYKSILQEIQNQCCGNINLLQIHEGRKRGREEAGKRGRGEERKGGEGKGGERREEREEGRRERKGGGERRRKWERGSGEKIDKQSIQW